MLRYRPRRVVRVSPTAAKPIQPIQTVESQYNNYSNYLNNNNIDSNSYPTIKEKYASAPSHTILQPEYYVHRENPRSLNSRNWAVRSIQSSSIDTDDPPRTTNARLKRQSREFIDRDPPTEESKSDFLDPIDFNNIEEIYSESQISYERRRPLSIECTYREDHRYLHNNDRLV